ncbi:MAG TPA: methyltransferase domain-containing protein [Acidobacteriaceae bacterium]|nr:methyltransferase domain-containing protein [Acidobacteriaceae bacterium]
MATVDTPPLRFDRVARIYRAMEYLSFGPLLERCRFSHLPHLRAARRALVLGDGDGRFTARLLAEHRGIRADAVDLSPAMLHLLRRRVAGGGAARRLTTTCADARSFLPSASDYDLVVTHFFLDCLTPEETAQLIARVLPCLAPGAVWLVSEFAVPNRGRVRRWLAQTLIASLYAAFRVLTGLTVRRIPPWRDLLAQAGFAPAASHAWLGGLLVSELWQPGETTTSAMAYSHVVVDHSRHSAPHAGSAPGIDPGPEPTPFPPPEPEPDPAPRPDPEPYPGPVPMPQPVTRA